jgi:CHAT domain-containing protein/tetratricopeptide (TPR) repeat protein
VRVSAAACLACALLAAAGCRPGPPPDVPRGVVVAVVAPGSAAAAAGLRPGDQLLAWESLSARPAGARGRLDGPFALEEVEREESPRATLRLEGLRSGSRLAVELREGGWGITSRPWLPAPLRAACEAATRRRAAHQPERALAAWRHAARQAEVAGRQALACWLWLQVADAAAGERLPGAGRQALERALAAAGAAGEPRLLARVHETAAAALERANDLGGAAAALDRALLVRQRARDRGLSLADDLDRRGWIALEQGDLAHAETLVRQARAIHASLSPESLAAITSLTLLAILSSEQGDSGAAEALFERSLAIARRRAPDGHATAEALGNLALLATYRGDLARAEALYGQALRITLRRAPASAGLARAYLNQGLARWGLGDLDAAESLFASSLQLWEKLAPGSLEVAGALNDLGLVALDRGELRAAESRFARALVIVQRVAPGNLRVSSLLNNLAIVSRERGDLARAEGLLRQAVARRERDSPAGYEVACDLVNLGDVLARRGDAAAAEGVLRRAVALLARTAPDTADEARAWQVLGGLLRATGRRREAIDALRRAAAALERQEQKLAGPEDVRSRFGAPYADIYRDLQELLLERGDEAAAFRVLERYRARRFLTVLAERDLRLARDLPPDLARDDGRLARESAEVQQALRLPGRSPREQDALLQRFHDLQARREALAARMRRAGPGLAALRYPRPVDAATAWEALEPGTLLLSYAVGERATTLFAVPRQAGRGPRLLVFRLPVGADELRDEVDAFRHLVQRPDAGPRSQAALRARGRRLFDTLLGLALPWVAASERLLVLPDGPLHSLPFAALLAPGAPGRPAAARYLVEWLPVRTEMSATVLLEQANARPPGHGGEGRLDLAAFGDPAYPPSRTAGVTAADAGRSSPDDRSALSPLPASRREVEGLAALFPRSRIFLGAAATAENVESVAGSARLLHFACHATLDERFPLESSLVLSAPGSSRPAGASGRFPAWQVMERLRVDADCVTLSACQTALGREAAGEGLMGLVRAFQYAGARSVVASLWTVADTTTAALMQRFYAGLRQGLPRDEALRRAQLLLLHQRLAAVPGPRRFGERLRQVLGPLVGLAPPPDPPPPLDASHPYYWAAFELTGSRR